jgi:hypothetical protein
MLKPAFVALTVLALTSSALAATKTASTEAALGVLPDCQISATDIDMGIYNSRTGASGTGTVVIKCNTPWAAFYSGFTGNLTKGADTIPYTLNDQVYWNAPDLRAIDLTDSVPLADRWLDYGNPNSVFVPTPPNTFITDPTVHHLIATVTPGLWKPAGTYSEIVSFTLEFPVDSCAVYDLCD